MYKAITNYSDLDRYINKISKIFNVRDFLGQPINKNEIIDYYVKSGVGYKIFHSLYGSMHMAISVDGILRRDDYFGQVSIVQGTIDDIKPTKVLELGCGNGVNSVFLAKKNPLIGFYGIDLTPQHITSARRLTGALNNVRFNNGDFQCLKFTNEYFDIVFEIESVCHATDMHKALAEIKRVMRPGGYLILFDGFRGGNFDKYDDKTQTAVRLVELAMATPPLWEIDKWIRLAEDIGFRVVDVTNISTAIMPNLAKFQFLARGYFKYEIISKLFMKILSRRLVANSISGLLMPFTISRGAQGYYKVILQAI